MDFASRTVNLDWNRVSTASEGNWSTCGLRHLRRTSRLLPCTKSGSPTPLTKVYLAYFWDPHWQAAEPVQVICFITSPLKSFTMLSCCKMSSCVHHQYAEQVTFLCFPFCPPSSGQSSSSSFFLWVPVSRLLVPSRVLTCTLNVNLRVSRDSYMSHTVILQGKKRSFSGWGCSRVWAQSTLTGELREHWSE